MRQVEKDLLEALESAKEILAKAEAHEDDAVVEAISDLIFALQTIEVDKDFPCH